MLTCILVSNLILATLFIATSMFFLVQIRKIRIRQDRTDVAVVSSIMEEGEDLSKRVLATHYELINKGGYSVYPREAMVEARRLHGLKP